MKQSIFYILLPILLLSACSNTNSSTTDGFELKGKLSNAHGDSLFLEQMTTDGLKAIDTVVLDENGAFTIHAAINEVGFYRLRVSEKNFATLILDANQKAMIKGDVADLANSYTIEGSPDSQLFWDVNQASATNYKKRDSLQKIFQAFVTVTKMDSLRIDSMSNALEKPYTELVNAHNVYLKNFIEKNTGSFASLAAIQQLQPEEFMDTYLKLDVGLFAKYPNSSYIKAFHESLAASQKLAIGTMAPEISMNTPDGNTLPLSSLKGKIILIDFWASWCGPCRAENPNVVKAYNIYKAKGFDIYSVSLDQDPNKWMAAIKADNLMWKNHVSDLQGWKSPVVALYKFNSIPSNVLIDTEGKIIAKDLRGEDLEKKLAELFK
jgi:thiol-disulfide isomerase/thioredoxin